MKFLEENSSPALIITATFTAEPLEPYLTYWHKQGMLAYDVTFAPYNQLNQQLLDPHSATRRNEKDGANLLLVRLEDWLRPTDGGPMVASQAEKQTEAWLAGAQQQLNTQAEMLVQGIKETTAVSAAPLFLIFCPPSPDHINPPHLQNLLHQQEQQLLHQLRSLPNLYLVSHAQLQAQYPVADSYAPATDALGHIPYTNEQYAALATLMVRELSALQRPPAKVIVLDCDNTLWGGVCGEDGAEGVRLEEPHLALQRFMIAQSQAGMLLCLASKNVEDDVWAVFDERDDMALQREHLVTWRINWQNKADNLRELAAELNVGLDSFIFVDDNPVEIATVQAQAPEVLAVHLPENTAVWPTFLHHFWPFDHLKVTAEDQKRTQLYQQNIARERMRETSTSLTDFLDSLNIEITISDITPADLPRVAQLTQRTNQFNISTKRRTEADIRTLQQEGKQVRRVHVQDRFGEYGLVGVMIAEWQPKALAVDSFMLSCRVLGRGVEQAMMRHLAQLAEDHGRDHLLIPFIPTAKNLPARHFLDSLPQAETSPHGEATHYHVPTAALHHLTATSHYPTTQPSTQSATPATLTPQTAPQTTRTQLSWVEIALTHQTPQAVLEATQSQRNPRPSLATPYEAPQTPSEKIIAEIWQEQLGFTAVGRHDVFYELGGHSLLAARILGRIIDQFQLNLPITALFDSPTVAALATKVDTLRYAHQHQSAEVSATSEENDLEEFEF